MDTLDPKTKKEIIKRNTPKSPVVKNTLLAFIIGGAICLFAEGARNLYLYLTSDKELSQLLATLTVVLIGGILTAVGGFDRLARHAGAGTLVPITGFSNSVVSSAIDASSEGYVSGVGTKIFTVAGPVILYATVAGVIYGIIYYLVGFL